MSSLISAGKPEKATDVLFMALVSLFFGVLGGVVGKPWLAVVGAIVVVVVFAAYNRVLERNSGLLSGLMTGTVMGIVAAGASVLVGGTIESLPGGLVYGVGWGASIGAVIGIISRAKGAKGDRWLTKLFLLLGSIGVGAFLGAGVGLVAGFLLGAVAEGGLAAIGVIGAGAVLGVYLGAYYREERGALVGALVGAALAAASILMGGAFAGAVLGAISGSIAPMLLVAAIGAFGGLTGRGPVAMVVEAVEAPSEMMDQGAIPFLVPAMIVGMIVGTAAAGVGALIVTPVGLAVVGLTFGMLQDMTSRQESRVTVRSLVEAAVMGPEEWRVGQVMTQVAGQSWKPAAVGAAIGLVLALAGSLVGVLVGQTISVFTIQ